MWECTFYLCIYFGVHRVMLVMKNMAYTKYIPMLYYSGDINL